MLSVAQSMWSAALLADSGGRDEKPGAHLTVTLAPHWSGLCPGVVGAGQNIYKLSVTIKLQDEAPQAFSCYFTYRFLFETNT